MKQIFTLFFILCSTIFVAQSQSLNSVLPASGAVGTTMSITINGTRTAFTNSTTFILTSGSSVITVTNVVAVNATKATGTIAIPANAASGSYTLMAIVGLGLPLQLANAFTVTGGAPVAALVSVTPNNGNQGQALLVTISGVHTTFTQSSSTTITLTSMTGGGTPIVIPAAYAKNDTTLQTLLNIPAAATTGLYAMAVSTSNDGTLILPNAFTVNGTSGSTPKLTAITPASGKLGQTLNVTITGANTLFTQTSNVTVSLFGSGSPITANYATATSNTSITANITIPTTESLGLHTLYVLTSNQGLLSLASIFNVTVTGGGGSGASIVSVAPNTGSRGQTLDVTITGANTHFVQSTSSLQVAMYNSATGVEANYVNTLSDTKLIANFTIPADFTDGLYTVGLNNDIDGIVELQNGFTVSGIWNGLNEVMEQAKFVIYPNPVRTKLSFESYAEVNKVLIYDISGKATDVDMQDVSNPDAHTYSVNIESLGLKKGIYFLRIETNDGTLYQKFIAE